ncbi:unnamed protein product [Gongylonema pulchrum]|uniref:Uncharacterized protein n=1 Tax=Gongylonema pulchrum TaxID=637853 RepID=A0A3P7N8Y0_9BILA|nr:unnamed protein product [Gongylonema pulchrum]
MLFDEAKINKMLQVRDEHFIKRMRAGSLGCAFLAKSDTELASSDSSQLRVDPQHRMRRRSTRARLSGAQQRAINFELFTNKRIVCSADI